MAELEVQKGEELGERERTEEREREAVEIEIKVELEAEKEIEETREIEEKVELYPECGSPRLMLDYRRGELICQDCGLVVEEAYIDEGPEWRAFDSEQKERRVRVGAAISYAIHDLGLTTAISSKDKDYSGSSLSPVSKAWFFRLRKWQRRIRISNAAERNLAFALGEIDRMVSALGLPRSIKEMASVIYRKALEKGLIKGRSIEAVAAAALYAACREAKIPRTLDEIAAYSKIERKEVGRTFRYIAKSLGLRLMPTSPSDYIPRFCAALNLDGIVQKKAIEIIRRAEEKELTSGRGPSGVAAAAIYIASIVCGDKRTQKEIATTAGVTEVTVRNRYKELAEKLGMEILL
ncbi:MAG: transcription initiation factor IIB [Archaeoglobus sp.]|nr:transcription initiation factor IIB [Archaeoglobus sp.]